MRHYAAAARDDPRLDARVPAASTPSGDGRRRPRRVPRVAHERRRPGLARDGVERAARQTTRLGFVDAKGEPLAGLARDARPRGRRAPGLRPRATARRGLDDRLRTARSGSRPRGRRTCGCSRPAGSPPSGGDLVPDTCREAKVTVPVAGVACVKCACSKGSTAPRIVLRVASRGEGVPQSTARRLRSSRAASAEPAEDGASVVVYEAPFRTDVGHRRGVAPARRSPKVTLDPAVPAVVTLP